MFLTEGNLKIDLRTNEIEPHSGITRNYLGEVITNIYNRPDQQAGTYVSTANGGYRSAQGHEDVILRKSGHSFRSANPGPELNSAPYVHRPQTIQANTIYQDGQTRYLVNGGSQQHIVHHVSGQAKYANRHAIRMPATSERKMSIGSHDGVLYGGNVNSGQVLHPGNILAARPALSDGGSRSSSVRRADRLSWYSNRQNDYDWVSIDQHEIKKFKVYSKGFYVVKIHEDDEVEQEFTLEDWRRQQASRPQEIKKIDNHVLDQIPKKLRLPLPTGTREMDYDELVRLQYSASKKAPSVYSHTSETHVNHFNNEMRPQQVTFAESIPRKTWPETPSGKILNSEDLRSILHNGGVELKNDNSYQYKKAEYSQVPVGKTVHGDEVYGFDSQGNPIISYEEASNIPIYGFTAHDRSPVYGFSKAGLPQTHFDSLKRPVIGFDASGRPVYDLKRDRFQVKAFDQSSNAILGFTRDQIPIYDVSSAGYIACAIDHASGQLCYGYDWRWKPVLEDDIRDIEENLKAMPVVALDEHRAKIYGFDEDRNPVYSFTKDMKPIFGYTESHYPVLGFDNNGSFVLTFDPDMRPVYGFDSESNPIYDLATIQSGSKVYFPPGVEYSQNERRNLFDVWGRQVDKHTVNQNTQNEGKNLTRRSSNASQYEFYDEKGEPFSHNQPLLDQTGQPLPSYSMLLNQKGQYISPQIQIFNEHGQDIRKSEADIQSRPVLDYRGQQIGVTMDGKTVLNDSSEPIATLSPTGKIRTLLPAGHIPGHQLQGDKIVNKDGNFIASVNSDMIVSDLRGIPFGRINNQGQLEVDEEMEKEIIKVNRASHSDEKFVPQLMLPNGTGRDALFSVTEREKTPLASNMTPKLFSVNSLGMVFGFSGETLGVLTASNVHRNQGSLAVVKDVRGTVVASVNYDGDIISPTGQSIGKLDPKGHELVLKQSEIKEAPPSANKERETANKFPDKTTQNQPIVPSVESSSNFKVGPNGQPLDSISDQSLGTMSELPAEIKQIFSSPAEKCLLDKSGKISAVFLKDGQIVNLDGSTIGTLSQGTSTRSIETHYMSEDGNLIGVYHKDKGIMTAPSGQVIAVKKRTEGSSMILADLAGKVIFEVTPQGNLVGQVNGIEIEPGLYERIKDGQSIPAAELKAIIEEGKLTPLERASREAKVELSSLLLLNQDGKPVGKVNNMHEVVDERGVLVGSIEPDGQFYDADGKLNPSVAGALMDPEGKMVAKYTNNLGFTLNGGNNIFAEPAIDTPKITGKTMGGYILDKKDQLVNEEGFVVAKLYGSQILSLDNTHIATVNADGSVEDLSGNAVTESGSIVTPDGVKLGQFHLLPKKESIVPLSSKLPVIADVEGHKIIGINQNGDFIIGIDDEGMPILGKVGYTKDGARITAIDIEGKPLPPKMVDEVHKLSNINHAKAQGSTKAIQQVVIEEDEEMEDTDRVQKSKKLSSHAGSGKLLDVEGVLEVVEQKSLVHETDQDEASGEEEDDEEEADDVPEIGGSARHVVHKLVKTESFIHVPMAEDYEGSEIFLAKQRDLQNELEAMESARRKLEEAIRDQESISNSPQKEVNSMKYLI